jgi:plastocyanin
MLALVSLMIPIFWILQGGHQAQAKNQLQAIAIERGMELYANNCTDRCYGIDSDDKVTKATYLGYTFAQLNQKNDSELRRIISGGIYNPMPVAGVPGPPSNLNTIPRSDQYGGQLQVNYVDYLFAFIRSTDPGYVQQQGYTGEAAHSGLELLPEYVQATLPTQYKAAQAFAIQGQFGQPVDMSAQRAITINMVPPKAGQTCTPHCYDPINVKVKVGTVITWVNNSDQPHTVTAKDKSGKDAAQIFDSGVNTLIQPGQSYQYKVTKAAFDLDAEKHELLYYCIIHPHMMAQLTIVE